MDLKDPREGVLCLVEPADNSLAALATIHRAMSRAIHSELISACHDVSDGGYLTAVAEMCVASGCGARLKALDDASEYFAEGNGCYVVETHALGADRLSAMIERAGGRVREIGRTSSDPILQIGRITPTRSEAFDCHVSIDDLTKAWQSTLDW
jgi:phosphoribosylformylglycinamidine synthase